MYATSSKNSGVFYQIILAGHVSLWLFLCQKWIGYAPSCKLHNLPVVCLCYAVLYLRHCPSHSGF